MADLVQVCDLADYDPQTYTCTSPYYEPQSTVLPVLSIADAQEIGMAVALLWAVAWIIRRIMRFIDHF